MMDLKQSLIGTELHGYRITHCIGEGGMAFVFRAENVVDHKIVRALKMIKPAFGDQEELFERFTQEARILEGLNHPNIVKFHGLRKAGKLLWMELEFLDGKSFAHSYFDKKKIPIEQALQWIYEATSAVAYAHLKKIIHRDIKPANLFITHDQEIKVLDFGIAKILNQISGQQKSVAQNQPLHQDAIHTKIFASPAYMSPEVCQGEQPNEAADVYALGLIFFQWVMGRHPLISPQAPPKTSVQMMMLHIENQVPPLRQVVQAASVGLENVFLKATSQNPRQRYSNAQAFLEALHFHLFHQPLDPPKPTTLTIPQLKINHLDTPVSLKALPKDRLSLPAVGPTAIFLSPALEISNRVLPEESPYELKNAKPVYQPLSQRSVDDPQEEQSIDQQAVAQTKVSINPSLALDQELSINHKKGGFNPKLSTTPEGMILGFEVEKPSQLKFHRFMLLLVSTLLFSLLYMLYHTQINHVLLKQTKDESIEWIDVSELIPNTMVSKTEITVAQYRLCVSQNKCQPPQQQASKGKCTWTAEADDFEQRPMNCVTYQNALEFAQFAQATLPSKEEWYMLLKPNNKAFNQPLQASLPSDKKAINASNLDYPWGNQGISCQYAVIYEKSPACQKDQMPLTPCSIAKGIHPLGICDLIGNTWEWVKATGTQAQLKKALTLGAGYYTDALTIQGSLEKERNMDHADSTIGFRLMKSKVDKPLSTF